MTELEIKTGGEVYHSLTLPNGLISRKEEKKRWVSLDSVRERIAKVISDHDCCDETECHIYGEQNLDEDGCVWKDLKKLVEVLK